MPAPRPFTLVAELSYQCPLHCPYCSNPVDIGGERWRAELETEHWAPGFRGGRALGGVQPALTRGGAIGGPDPHQLAAAARGGRPGSAPLTRGPPPTRERARPPRGQG